VNDNVERWQDSADFVTLRLSSTLKARTLRLSIELQKRAVRLSSALDVCRVRSTRHQCRCRVHSTANASVECTRQDSKGTRQRYSGARQIAPIGMHLSSAMYSNSLIVSSAHTLILICARAQHPIIQVCGWFLNNILEQLERVSAYTKSA